MSNLRSKSRKFKCCLGNWIISVNPVYYLIFIMKNILYEKMLLLLWVCIASPVILLAQNISFEINQGPTQDTVWTDTLVKIGVTVYAPVQVTSVNAAIGTRQSALTSSGVGSFTGSISLAGLPGDTMLLKLTAQDVQQHQATLLLHSFTGQRTTSA